MLWDDSTPPNGWEVYTAAQGRFVMGYIPSGINIYNNPKQGNLDWKTVLESVGSTYDPGTPGRNISAYGFHIGGTDLPLHQHAVAVGKENVVMVIIMLYYLVTGDLYLVTSITMFVILGPMVLIKIDLIILVLIVLLIGI